MPTQYYTFEEQPHKEKAQQFIQQHQPKPKHLCCCLSRPCSLALTIRFLLRNAIPVILGVTAGISAKKIETNIQGSDKKSLFCDIVNGVTTLMIAYIMDWLLGCCWPLTPYPKTHLFQPISRSHNTSEVALQMGKINEP